MFRFFFADPFKLRIKSKSLEDIPVSTRPTQEEKQNQPDEFARIMRLIIDKLSDETRNYVKVD